MNSDPQNWIKRWVEKRSLPALKQTAIDLNTLYKEADPFKHLADVIHRDPAVTCHSFSHANGVHHHHFGVPVTTVEHAAMMLGLDRIRSVAESLDVIDPAEEKHRGLRKVYSRAYLAAHFSVVWARQRVDMVPWEVFAATLLHEVGEMAVWVFQPDKAEEIEDLIHGAGQKSREAAQHHVLGFSYDQLSAELARYWKLPLLVHDSLNSHCTGRPRVRLILLAHRLARAAEKDWYSQKSLSCIDEAAELLHSSYADMVSAVHRAAVAAARAYTVYGIRPAAAGLITIPAFRGLTGASGGGDKQPSGKTSTQPAKPQVQLTPRPEILEQTIQWFNEIDNKAPSLPIIMKQAADGIHKGIGFSRVVFAACTPDQKALKARVILGTEESTEFEQLRLELHPPHLFSKLMEKPASIWVNHKNRSRFGKLLPHTLLEMLGTDSFFARSLFLNDRPLGMFYCDCHQNPACLDETRYKEFQHLCDYVTAAIHKATLL